MTSRASVFFIAAVGMLTPGCQKATEPFSVADVDRTVGESEYPLAVEPTQVGTFPPFTKSGGGYFYDEVLE